MATPSGWQRKLLLIFKSERIIDAPSVIEAFAEKKIDEMKSTLITEQMCRSSALTNKPRTKNLINHLDNLKHQFIGQSELCFYHAALIVLLRRQYQSDKLFMEFEQLWESQSGYLLSNLSLRWIVSACDTFIDHSANATRAAILMNVVTLINTLKVYETQQFLQGSNSQFEHLVPDNIEALYSTHLPLYEGLSYFRIGTDDTLHNMRKRYERYYSIDKLATTMLLFVFDKLQDNKSAFYTMKSFHKDEKSKWW